MSHFVTSTTLSSLDSLNGLSNGIMVSTLPQTSFIRLAKRPKVKEIYTYSMIIQNFNKLNKEK